MKREVFIVILLYISLTACFSASEQDNMPLTHNEFIAKANGTILTICLDGVSYYAGIRLGVIVEYKYISPKYSKNGDIIRCNDNT